MQTAILSQLSCSLVPHSTRPFWHQKWEQQCQKQQNEVPKSSNSARRRLFQEEMDPEEEKSNQEFVQRLLAELTERYKQKWNFDFDQGQPMNAANHPLKYEAVSAKQVPGFYRISTIFGQNPPHKNVHLERDENHWSPAEENATKMNGGIGEFVEGKATDLDGQMMAESGIGPMKSPSRILAKSKRRTTENETPKRSKKVSGSNRNSSMEWAMEEGTNGQIAGEQSKITDFLNVRKGLATRSCTKTKKESAGIVMNSPKSRRHSLCLPISMHNSSPIKKVSVDFHRAQRRSQRLFHARQMLFK